MRVRARARARARASVFGQNRKKSSQIDTGQLPHRVLADPIWRAASRRFKMGLLNSHCSWLQIREKTMSVGSILRDNGLIHLEVPKKPKPAKRKKCGCRFFQLCEME